MVVIKVTIIIIIQRAKNEEVNITMQQHTWKRLQVRVLEDHRMDRYLNAIHNYHYTIIHHQLQHAVVNCDQYNPPGERITAQAAVNTLQFTCIRWSSLIVNSPRLASRTLLQNIIIKSWWDDKGITTEYRPANIRGTWLFLQQHT